MVARARAVWTAVFATAGLGLLGAMVWSASALPTSLTPAALGSWLEDAYAYVLLWLVVIQALVAASAASTMPKHRTRLRWVTFGLVVLLASSFPLFGDLTNFAVSYVTFAAGALVVSLMDATIGDVWIDYVPARPGQPLVGAERTFVAPHENVSAIYMHVVSSVGATPRAACATAFSRRVRVDGGAVTFVGGLHITGRHLNKRLVALSIRGPVDQGVRHRVEAIVAILGSPSTCAEDVHKVLVGCSDTSG